MGFRCGCGPLHCQSPKVVHTLSTLHSLQTCATVHQAEYHGHLVYQEVDCKSMCPREHVSSGIPSPYLEILFSKSLEVLTALLLCTREDQGGNLDLRKYSN